MPLTMDRNRIVAGIGVHNLDKTMGNSKISVDNLLDNSSGVILLK